MPEPTPTAPTSLPRRKWAGLLILGLAGQLAWAVENQFFNTFMYNEISPEPRYISWMVSITAAVSTLTAISMGALSDRLRTRWGRRRPFLFLGYLLWGILTALYPTSALFQPVGLAVGMAILYDSLMTFFGASANDASFNAYVADITTIKNRGRVSGVLQIMTWVATLIVYGGAGPLIDAVGYPAFFYIIGGVVFVAGLASSLLVHEPPLPPAMQISYINQITRTFKLQNLRANRTLFELLFATTVFTLSQQIFFPYLVIYLQHYVKLETMQYSILVAVAILVGGVLMAYPVGILVDRWGRRPVALLAVVGEALGLILFSISNSYIWLVITGILWLLPITAWTIAIQSWTKDLYPEEDRGQFAGYYILFTVAFAMIPGPLIGGWLATQYGIPSVLNGQAGHIPPPLLFQVAGAGTLLTLIPLLMTGKSKKE
jgi:MFS family permease